MISLNLNKNASLEANEKEVNLFLDKVRDSISPPGISSRDLVDALEILFNAISREAQKIRQDLQEQEHQGHFVSLPNNFVWVNLHKPQMWKLTILERSTRSSNELSIGLTIEIFSNHIKSLQSLDLILMTSYFKEHENQDCLEIATYARAPALMQACLNNGASVEKLAKNAIIRNSGIWKKHQDDCYRPDINPDWGRPGTEPRKRKEHYQNLTSQCINILIKNKWDFNVPILDWDSCPYKRRPVQVAIEAKDFETMICLLKFNADVNLPPTEDQTADEPTLLHRYVKHFPHSMILADILQYGAPDLFKVNSKQQTAIDVVDAREKRIKETLISYKVEYINTINFYFPNAITDIVLDYLFDRPIKIKKMLPENTDSMHSMPLDNNQMDLEDS